MVARWKSRVLPKVQSTFLFFRSNTVATNSLMQQVRHFSSQRSTLMTKKILNNFGSPIEVSNKMRMERNNASIQGSTQRKYKGNKKFFINGAVDRNISFFVSYEQWNEANLLPAIKDGHYKLLIYPSQSGKTTRIKELIPMLRQQGYFPIYVDMANVICDFRQKIQPNENVDALFVQQLLGQFNLAENKLKHNIEISKHYKLSDIFCNNGTKEYFGENAKVVLLLDEFDAMLELDTILSSYKVLDATSTRRFFLSALCSLKPVHFAESSLHSIIGITNAIFDLSTTNSSFTDHICGSYFTKHDADVLWEQYEEQEEIILDRRIKDDIFLRSGGAPGAFTMLASYFHNFEFDHTKPLPTYDEWIQASYSNNFWIHLHARANFQKITNQLQRDIVRRKVLQLVVQKNFGVLGNDVELLQLLQRANIVKENSLKKGLDFASPLVTEYIAYCFNSPNITKLIDGSSLITSDGKLDMVLLLKTVISNMNRYIILIGEKKTNNTDKGGNQGPNEQVYRTEFVRTLTNTIASFSICSKEKSYTGKSYNEIDDILQGFGCKIGVKHCANTAIANMNSLTNDTLMYHVDKAHHFLTNKNVDQAVVIHWTSVENNFKIKYIFPQKTSQGENTQVETIYVYHNPDCSLFKIVTSNTTVIIDLPDPLELLNENSEHASKELYVKIGNNEKSMKDITIEKNRVDELLCKIQQKFADKIQGRTFNIWVERGDKLFPVSEDASVAELDNHSILQIEFKEN